MMVGFRKNIFFAFLLFFTSVFFVSVGCAPGELRVKDVSFCDNFNSQSGVCTEPHGEQRTYRPEIPVAKQSSWYDFSYHLYFHTRETPGLLVELNRPLTEKEVQVIDPHRACRYVLGSGEQKVSSPMEGFRISARKDRIWCFDYLGTMLLTYQKKNKNSDGIPDPAFFPVDFSISLNTGIEGVKARSHGKIHLEWN